MKLSKMYCVVAAGCATVFSMGAIAAGGVHHLQIQLLRDGKLIVAGEIPDVLVANSGFATSSGRPIGYAVCQKVGDATQIATLEKFVGMSLLVQTLRTDGDAVDLSLSAADTVERGISQIGPQDCPSQVVATEGLTDNDVRATIRDGQTIDVPLNDPRYHVHLSMKAD